MDKGISQILNFPLKGKYVALVSPSFFIDFEYPKIISQLKKLGFDKIVELTFGAKLINREYAKILKNSQNLLISSVCPGVVEIIKNSFPNYKENLIKIDSPMIATAKICKKIYPSHKRVFISPCYFKKIEVNKTGLIDYVINYKELKSLLIKNNLWDISINNKRNLYFDRFYNDYTKIYPIAGGLSKTLKIKKILSQNKIKELNGIKKLIRFLNKPDKKITFIDTTYCKGGCINGPCVNNKRPVILRKRKILKYLRLASKEKIPQDRKGIFEKAKGISFNSNFV